MGLQSAQGRHHPLENPPLIDPSPWPEVAGMPGIEREIAKGPGELPQDGCEGNSPAPGQPPDAGRWEAWRWVKSGVAVGWSSGFTACFGRARGQNSARCPPQWAGQFQESPGARRASALRTSLLPAVIRWWPRGHE